MANISKQQEFQRKLETFCWPHGGEIPTAWGKCVSCTILEFLKDQFKEGKAYRTIVYRSALSAVLPEIDSSRVGAHPLVSQFLKGIFHLRPPPSLNIRILGVYHKFKVSNMETPYK